MRAVRATTFAEVITPTRPASRLRWRLGGRPRDEQCSCWTFARRILAFDPRRFTCRLASFRIVGGRAALVGVRALDARGPASPGLRLAPISVPILAKPRISLLCASRSAFDTSAQRQATIGRKWGQFKPVLTEVS